MSAEVFIDFWGLWDCEEWLDEMFVLMSFRREILDSSDNNVCESEELLRME